MYELVNMILIVIIETCTIIRTTNYKELVKIIVNDMIEFGQNILANINTIKYKEVYCDSLNRFLSYIGTRELRLLLMFIIFLIVAKIFMLLLNIKNELRVFETYKSSLASREIEVEIKHKEYCKINQEHTSRLNYFLENYYAKNQLNDNIENLIEQSVKLVENGRKWQETHSDVEQSEYTILNKKLFQIENVMVSEEYNDPDYLIFSDMTMSELKTESKLLNLPNCNWGCKQALAHCIRLTKQLNDLIEIVQPVYPDGYETESMEQTDNEPE